MIKSIKVTNHLGESICIELFNPEKTGLLIDNIEGLGPPSANISMTELAVSDGSMFNSARLNSRNIVISMIFFPLPTIEDSRLRVYKYFPIKKNITIEVLTDRRDCITEGFVETVEPDIFSERESCQVSIVCPNSYLYSVKPLIIYYNGVESLFEFPFSNESLIDDELIMGEINKVSSYNIFYEGSIETGITIHAIFRNPVKGLIFYNPKTRVSLQIDDEILKSIIGSYFTTGDELTISTERGKRKASVLRNGRLINIINALKRPIGWLTLSSGHNTISYNASEGMFNMDLRIEYQTAYDGI